MLDSSPCRTRAPGWIGRFLGAALRARTAEVELKAVQGPFGRDLGLDNVCALVSGGVMCWGWSYGAGIDGSDWPVVPVQGQPTANGRDRWSS